MKELMTMTLLETTESMMREIAQEVLHKANRRRKRGACVIELFLSNLILLSLC